MGHILVFVMSQSQQPENIELAPTLSGPVIETDDGEKIESLCTGKYVGGEGSQRVFGTVVEIDGTKTVVTYSCDGDGDMEVLDTQPYTKTVELLTSWGVISHERVAKSVA